MCCLGGLSGVVKVCTFRTTACEALGGLRVEALSGSLSCRRRSSRGKIGQLAEALFGESEIWTNQENWVWTITSHVSRFGKIVSKRQGFIAW